MSARVFDLLGARRDRRKPAMHFDTDAEALHFIAERLDHLRSEAGDSLLVSTDCLRRDLAQIAAVVDAVLNLYCGSTSNHPTGRNPS